MLALATKNLTKKFDPVSAVRQVNLAVKKGEIIGIIGPDGAGKTTLVRMLNGLLHPTSGSVEIMGLEVAENTQSIKEKMGYMPQHFSLYGDLSVGENLKFFADLYGVEEARFKQRRKELLKFSGLSPFQNRSARNLSGGMQKKLALACNLLHKPQILLLDEPTTGVDPVSRRELWHLLAELNSQGVTLIITTPYMDEAHRCQRVALMHEGTVLEFRSPQALIQEIKEEVIELRVEDIQVRSILRNLPDLINIYPFGQSLHLIFEQGAGGEAKTRDFLKKQGINVLSVKKITPSFEDVFLLVVTRKSPPGANHTEKNE